MNVVCFSAPGHTGEEGILNLMKGTLYTHKLKGNTLLK